MLKVGELAKHTGLTVRTLHHYDAIGLLTPSGRSESGYRLYSPSDVQRLHGIQALRNLDMPLDQIAAVLGGEGGGAERLLEQQIGALEAQIKQASELQGRLRLMHEGIVAGEKPGMGDWLETLALMTTYGKYFSAAELRTIFENWKAIEHEWVPLMAEMQSAMDRQLAPDSFEMQPLTNRWMTLMLHWMEGDFDLIDRWGRMFAQEPSAHGKNSAPTGEMIEFVGKAIDVRLAVFAKHMDPADLRGIGHVPLADWRKLAKAVADLVERGVAPGSPESLPVLAMWRDVNGRLTRGDVVFQRKLLAAFNAEPLLQAGSSLTPQAREYLRKCMEALGPNSA